MYTQSLHGTFNDQSMSIGCIGKLQHLSSFLWNYLLNSPQKYPCDQGVKMTRAPFFIN